MSSLRRSVVLVSALALGVIGMLAPTASYAESPFSAGGAVKFRSPDFADAGGSLPQRTAAGDFNGDGNLDEVTVNEGPSPLFGMGIGVSLGDGAGKLGRTVTTDVGSGYGACDVAVGNWNGDAMDDLVVRQCTTGGTGDLVVLLATGGGHFTVTQSFASPTVQIVSGDFNEDGKPDFVTSTQGSPRVTTYLGQGNGLFNEQNVTSPSFDSYDLAVGDVDNDGHLDLVGAAGGPVWTMLGNGDGTFGDQRFRSSSVLTGVALALGDVNSDGNLDVAVVDASGGHVGVGLGDGRGSFADGDQIRVSQQQAVWVAVGQVTNDRNADIVVGVDNDSRVSALLRSLGNGHFAKPTHWVVGSAGLTLADFTGDGRDDLISFVGTGRVYLSVARNNGFSAARLMRGPLSQDLVDVNGDGVLDKVSGTTGLVHGKLRSQLVVQLGRGDGRFGPQIVSHIRNETASSGVGDIDVADVNEDGVPDVVGGFENFQASPHNLFWMLGKGNGSFGSATLWTVGDTNADVNAIAAADVNGDGHVDIVANNLAQLVVRLGKGDGTFEAPIASGMGSGSDRAVLVGDFTGDGVKDVVTTVRTGNEDFGRGEIRLQQGDGQGRFALVQTQHVDSNLNSGVAADLNGDQRPDIATAGSAGFDGGRDALWVLLTTPGGKLGEPTPYAGPTGQVDTGDLDLDGDLDIATTGSATIDFYLNDGAGGFPKTTDIIAAGGLGAVGRINSDKAPDVLAGGPGGEFAVHLNAR